MAASASAAKRTFMNLARGNGEATGYHMRHDPSALPRCGIRGDLPALRHSARRHRPALSATSRAPRRSPARGGTHRRPRPAPRRRVVRLVRPALRGPEPRGAGGGGAHSVRWGGGARARGGGLGGGAVVFSAGGRPGVRGGGGGPFGTPGGSRAGDLPDIPPLAERVYPAVTSTSGTGIVAPA